MRSLFLSLILAAIAGAQARPESATDLLKRVEKRYNSLKTMQASFTQVDTDRNRPRPAERGTLYLRKEPNATRWEYTNPVGNFFLSADKTTYHFEKAENTVTRAPFKETEDTRVPLSFLLGKLDFNKDFKEFRDKPGSDGRIVEMLPKNEKLEFDKITIVVMPDATIRRVIVSKRGYGSTEYVLEGEQLNPKLPDSLFKFQAPPGAKIIDAP